MNNKVNNNYTYIHKKRVHPPSLEESELATVEFPRKKFISEESFANDMAAMSLYPRINENYRVENFQQQQQQQQQQPHENVVQINNINEFLSNEDENDTAYMDTTERMPIFGDDINGLPLELKPGDKKPRIPDFIIDSSSSLDPRDRIALRNMMKSNMAPGNVQIEVLNNPTSHYTPTSMDID